MLVTGIATGFPKDGLGEIEGLRKAVDAEGGARGDGGARGIPAGGIGEGGGGGT